VHARVVMVLLISDALLVTSGATANLSINDPDTVAIRTLNTKMYRVSASAAVQLVTTMQGDAHHSSAQDDRVETCMLPIADGVALAVKK